MGSVETEVRPDPDGVDEDIAAAARRTVAHYALDAEDCAGLLDMLGLRDEPACRACGGPMLTHGKGGYKQGRGADGMCRDCHRKRREQEQREQKRREQEQGHSKCACGHLATVGELCGRCAQSVPRDDLRAVVERIVRDTGWSVAEIARRARMLPPTLRSHLAPGNRTRVHRNTYTAVLRVAQELSA